MTDSNSTPQESTPNPASATPGAASRFEELFAELQHRAAARPEGSGTVAALDKGTHFIGKKIVEEAAEVWMASEFQSREEAAEEMSQLIYWLQVMMVDRDISLDDLYRYL